MKRQRKSAGKLLVLENGDPISAEAEQIQNRIRERAYEISQMRGHPGREMDDWLSAESDVISVPPMDMVEKDGVFKVQMAAPGIDPRDLSVMASPEQVLVKCDSRHTHEEGAGILHVCDFKSATLFRSFRFPQAIDVQSLKVDFQDGMLRITAIKEGSTPAPQKRPAARKSAATKSKRRSA
jgi:HSP20 family molecular chaperone IbpA